MENFGKKMALIGAIIGIVCTIVSFLFQLLELDFLMAWWQIEYEKSFETGINGYISAFGTSNQKAGNILGDYGLYAGILFTLGSVLVLLTSYLEKKAIAFLCTILMIVGLFLYLYAVLEWVDHEDFLEGLTFFKTGESSILYGSTDLGNLGIVNWRLGNGFLLGTAATILCLIGSAKIESD